MILYDTLLIEQFTPSTPSSRNTSQKYSSSSSNSNRSSSSADISPDVLIAILSIIGAIFLVCLAYYFWNKHKPSDTRVTNIAQP